MTETTMTLERIFELLDRDRYKLGFAAGLPLTTKEYFEALALARRALEQPVPTGEVTREHREAAESAFDVYNRSELTDLCDAFAQVLATREHAAFIKGRESARATTGSATATRASDILREDAATIQAFAGERSAELSAYLLSLFEREALEQPVPTGEVTRAVIEKIAATGLISSREVIPLARLALVAIRRRTADGHDGIDADGLPHSFQSLPDPPEELTDGAIISSFMRRSEAARAELLECLHPGFAAKNIELARLMRESAQGGWVAEAVALLREMPLVGEAEAYSSWRDAVDDWQARDPVGAIPPPPSDPSKGGR